MLALVVLLLVRPCCARWPNSRLRRRPVHRAPHGSGANKTTTRPVAVFVQNETAAEVRCNDEAVSDTGGAESGPKGTTYSVIVVANNAHRSNLFRDRARMCAYSKGVVSVQIVGERVHEALNETSIAEPFYVGHPVGVDKRVRVLHVYHTNEIQVGAFGCCRGNTVWAAR